MESIEEAKNIFQENIFYLEKLKSLEDLVHSNIQYKLLHRLSFVIDLKDRIPYISFDDLENLKAYYPEFNIRHFSTTATVHRKSKWVIFDP